MFFHLCNQSYRHTGSFKPFSPHRTLRTQDTSEPRYLGPIRDTSAVCRLYNYKVQRKPVGRNKPRPGLFRTYVFFLVSVLTVVLSVG